MFVFVVVITVLAWLALATCYLLRYLAYTRYYVMRPCTIPVLLIEGKSTLGWPLLREDMQEREQKTEG